LASQLLSYVGTVVDTMASCIAIFHGFIWCCGPGVFLHVQGQKEHLAIIDKFCRRRQNVGDTNQIVAFNNRVVSACCGLSCYSHRVSGKNDRILSFCIVSQAIPNLVLVLVLTCRVRVWRLYYKCSCWMSHA